MEILLDIVILAASILLIMVVLIQDSKGGGLTSSFGASNQILGVRKTTDFLEKATWALAIAVIVFSLASAWIGEPSGNSNIGGSVTKQQADNLPAQQGPQK